jgi:hypothetical protein
MITAVKDRPAMDVESVRERIQALAAFYGIRKQRLAEWMGEDIGTPSGIGKNARLATQMPPPSAE